MFDADVTRCPRDAGGGCVRDGQGPRADCPEGHPDEAMSPVGERVVIREGGQVVGAGEMDCPRIGGVLALVVILSRYGHRDRHAYMGRRRRHPDEMRGQASGPGRDGQGPIGEAAIRGGQRVISGHQGNTREHVDARVSAVEDVGADCRGPILQGHGARVAGVDDKARIHGTHGVVVSEAIRHDRRAGDEEMVGGSHSHRRGDEPEQKRRDRGNSETTIGPRVVHVGCLIDPPGLDIGPADLI